jgi:uncharacterized protein
LNNLAFTVVVLVCSIAGGFVGSLVGLGGGFVVTPLLTLVFGVDIRYAIGASLISVIATSSGAAAAYVKEGFTNLRVGMLLEVATTTGALVGATLVTVLPARAIAIVFGVVLIQAAFVTSRRHADKDTSAATPDPLATRLRLDSTYPTAEGLRAYRVRRVPLGFGIMWVAGVISGLLGIGAGAVKVLAMDQAMYIPFKVSTATSNFMIGVTAAASAGIYLRAGYVDPELAMPVMLGVSCGALVGARLLYKAPTARLRLLFGVVVALVGLEMIYHGLAGGL